MVGPVFSGVGGGSGAGRAGLSKEQQDISASIPATMRSVLFIIYLLNSQLLIVYFSGLCSYITEVNICQARN
jgi:hypothetical protein